MLKVPILGVSNQFLGIIFPNETTRNISGFRIFRWARFPSSSLVGL